MKADQIYKLHFIGIGGIGMSGIAEIFISQGHQISGSDLSLSDVTEHLAALGATIYANHRKENIRDADVVVTSSAVKGDNPEVLEAKRLGIPVIPRAEMLAEIMRGKTGISVAGTHGKTTTTSMTAQILMEAGFDPTVVVGGKVEAIGSNAKVGLGDVVVVEADESDGSFHLLPATHGIVTNIDLDHMEYYGTRENLNEAFIQFTKKIPFYGCTWLCAGDPGVQQILPFLTKPHHTYGFSTDADLYAARPESNPLGSQTYELFYRKSKNLKHESLGVVELSVLGRHNILNSMAAIGMAMSLGAPISAAKAALKRFHHVKRRFDEKFFSSARRLRVIDDYGHHPTEIRAVLETARQTNPKRILTLFQPHRYSRTKLCWDDFLSCFEKSDILVLLPIYAASEEPLAGITSILLAEAIRERPGSVLTVKNVDSAEDALEWVMKNHQDGDLILTLGAGSITKLSDAISAALS
jgi:UDP-N-acetylmuramate--alanine ligase